VADAPSSVPAHRTGPAGRRRASPTVAEELDEPLRRQGPADQAALDLVRLHHGETAPLVGGLHALGEHAHPQGMSQADDRPDDRQVVRVRGDPLDERLVDLEPIEGEVSQVAANRQRIVELFPPAPRRAFGLRWRQRIVETGGRIDGSSCMKVTLNPAIVGSQLGSRRGELRRFTPGIPPGNAPADCP